MTRGECLEPGLGSPEMMADLEDQTADPTREELAEGPPPPPGWELGVAMGDIDPETNKKIRTHQGLQGLFSLKSNLSSEQSNYIWLLGLSAAK